MLRVLYVIKYLLLYLIDDAIESKQLIIFFVKITKKTPEFEPDNYRSAVECSH